MRPLATVVLLLAVLVAGCAAPAEGTGIVQQRIDLRLDPDRGLLQGVAHLELPPGSRAFALDPALAVQRLVINGREQAPAAQAGRYSLSGDADVPLRVEIHYAGRVDADAARRIGWLLSGEGSYLPAGSGWHPQVPEALLRYELRVRLPTAQRALAAGELLDERTTVEEYAVTFRQRLPVPGITLVAGPYAIDERRDDALRLRTYFTPAVAHLAPAYLDRSQDYLRLYSDWIGPYPFPGFAVAASPLPVGLGFQGFTYIGERVLQLPFILDSSLPHEILHNWWGNGVYVDYATGNWAEGLTTLMADYQLAKRRNPGLAREMRADWLRDYAALPAEHDRPLRAFVARDHGGAGQIVGYHKAAMVFLMLRDRLGTETFDAAIRRFWERHRFQTASWDDLRAAFEQASGEDLRPWFGQWLERTGAPQLRLEQVEVTPAERGYRLRAHLLQAAPAYDLQVPLRVMTADGEVTRTLAASGERTVLDVQLGARPLVLEIDPDYRLFRRLAAEELPVTLRRLMLSPATRVLLADDHAAARDPALTLAGRLLGRTAESTDQRPDRAPLLVIGTTTAVEHRLRQLDLPERPTRLARQGTARAWTGADGRGTPFLVVEVEDPQELAALARRLPHYGSRSYVVFEHGQVVDQGVWEVGAHPLRVEFPPH